MVLATYTDSGQLTVSYKGVLKTYHGITGNIYREIKKLVREERYKEAWNKLRPFSRVDLYCV